MSRPVMEGLLESIHTLLASNSRREREHPGNGPDWTPKRVEWGRNRTLERSLGTLAGAAAFLRTALTSRPPLMDHVRRV